MNTTLLELKEHFAIAEQRLHEARLSIIDQWQKNSKQSSSAISPAPSPISAASASVPSPMYRIGDTSGSPVDIVQRIRKLENDLVEMQDQCEKVMEAQKEALDLSRFSLAANRRWIAALFRQVAKVRQQQIQHSGDDMAEDDVSDSNDINPIVDDQTEVNTALDMSKALSGAYSRYYKTKRQVEQQAKGPHHLLPSPIPRRYPYADADSGDDDDDDHLQEEGNVSVLLSTPALRRRRRK